MKFEKYSHRYGLEIINGDPEASRIFSELEEIINSIDEHEVVKTFIEGRRFKKNNHKSISPILNSVIKEKLTNAGWEKEVQIFKDRKYSGKESSAWRLDFAYPGLFSMEVAFNHSSAALVNLMKPVLASEINHVQKALDGENRTKFGIIITAKQSLRENGGFDSAIGTYEKYIKQLKPYMNILLTPTVIIGLEGLENYSIIKTSRKGSSSSQTVITKRENTKNGFIFTELHRF